MIFQETILAGVFVIEPERKADDRGFFARTFCAEEFAGRGLQTAFAQCSLSHNVKRGLLRGMHYQLSPHAEVKLVRCTSGRVFDVALDLRPASPTYCRWVGTELSAETCRQIYIPEGCAHGFVTLAESSEVSYQISVPFAPKSSTGVRWNDPAFAIEWPVEIESMSDRDRAWPDYVPARPETTSMRGPG